MRPDHNGQMASPSEPLTALPAGAPVIYGGNQITRVSEELAASFRPGDRLVVVQSSGHLLHIPAAEHALVTDAVRDASAAFAALGAIDDGSISAFYGHFADRLADNTSFAPILAANALDVAEASARGRSTTRLVLSDKMRSDMIAGLRMWRDAPSRRDTVIERIEHRGWTVEQRAAGVGVVGFVFEGRPNVFADATGVLRSGNTVVFRIGSDALGTARAIMTNAVEPALVASGLPAGAVRLLDSPSRATGWALFSDARLALAVARGSGEAVEQLGAVARQAGLAVSLHGTGGAWIIATEHADADRFSSVAYHSLDRKVCNTINVCCITATAAHKLVPVLLDVLERAAQRRSTNPKLHVTAAAHPYVPAEWFTTTLPIARAGGPVTEAQAELLPDELLGREWEWEESPELTVHVVPDLAGAIAAFNAHSPRLVASLVSVSDAEQEQFWAQVDAPFVGDGFTRWVDGQFALDRPELGLSNWEHGRLFGRSAVLSGDSVFTVRTRVRQSDADLHR